jgi:hypothetical protein
MPTFVRMHPIQITVAILQYAVDNMELVVVVVIEGMEF